MATVIDSRLQGLLFGKSIIRSRDRMPLGPFSATLEASLVGGLISQISHGVHPVAGLDVFEHHSSAQVGVWGVAYPCPRDSLWRDQTGYNESGAQCLFLDVHFK
jgi:hypothetical protein